MEKWILVSIISAAIFLSAMFAAVFNALGN
jgi:hypothetical protein